MAVKWLFTYCYTGFPSI